MLDTFLKVAAERAQKAHTNARAVELMTRLPKDTLVKIASGEMKLSYLCGSDDDWLEKYKGTAMLGDAVQLAQQELAIEQEDIQNRAQRKAERDAEPDTWEQKDQLRLQKKLLDLELAKANLGGAEEPPEEAPLPEEPPPPGPAPAAMPPPNGPPGMGAEPMKEAAARMRKVAFSWGKKEEGPSIMVKKPSPALLQKKLGLNASDAASISGGWAGMMKSLNNSDKSSYQDALYGKKTAMGALKEGFTRGGKKEKTSAAALAGKTSSGSKLGRSLGPVAGGAALGLGAYGLYSAAKKGLQGGEGTKTSAVEERFAQQARIMLIKSAQAKQVVGEELTEQEKQAFSGAALGRGLSILGKGAKRLVTRGVSGAQKGGWQGMKEGIQSGASRTGKLISGFAKKNPWETAAIGGGGAAAIGGAGYAAG